jgi:hypothetical protein
VLTFPYRQGSHAIVPPCGEGELAEKNLICLRRCSSMRANEKAEKARQEEHRAADRKGS